MRRFVIVVVLTLSAAVVAADGPPPPPVFDVHLHAMAADGQGPPPLAMCTSPTAPFPAWDPAGPAEDTFFGWLKNPPCDDPVWSPETDDEVRDRTIAEMERRNVYGVLSGTPERVAEWMREAPGRFVPGLGFNLARGGHTPESLRTLHEDGRLAVLAEVTNQYAGIEPDDPRMEPFWTLAEELDLPVGIHVGPGPPGVIYLGAERYRARMHGPLGLEDVLVRHPRLRVYVMHAGYPMIDDTLALLYAHPQVYVGTGVIVFTQPRAAFYRYLERIVEAGFGNRVLFGTDQMVWPETIGRSIDVIREAPFLTEDQKRAILYDNAARFFRFDPETVARHHGRNGD